MTEAQETVTRWRHRPEEVEAVEWDGSDEVRALLGEWGASPESPSGEGRVYAPGTTWFSRRIDDGKVFVWRSEKFADEYEPAADNALDPQVRLSRCPVQDHDADHVQVRTREVWMCGHLLADALAASGIPPVLAGDRDRLADELEQARAQLRNYSGNRVTYLSAIGQAAAALLAIAGGCEDPADVARKALSDVDEVKRLEAEMTALRAERDEACRGVAEMSGAFDPDRPGIPLDRVEHWRMFAASHPDGDGDGVTLADVIAERDEARAVVGEFEAFAKRETVPFDLRAELLRRAGIGES
jgi:hypothetical protein